MRTVVWNALAEIDYFENIDCLLGNWSEKAAQLGFGTTIKTLIS